MEFEAEISLGEADIVLRETFGYKFDKKLHLFEEELCFLNATSLKGSYDIANFY